MVEEDEQAPVQQPAPLLQLLQGRRVGELDAALQLAHQDQGAVPVGHQDLQTNNHRKNVHINNTTRAKRTYEGNVGGGRGHHESIPTLQHPLTFKRKCGGEAYLYTQVYAQGRTLAASLVAGQRYPLT